MKITPKQLNSLGVSHLLLPLIAVVLVAVIGTFLLVSSHADPISRARPTKAGTLKIKAYYRAHSCIDRNSDVPSAITHACKPKLDTTSHLFVTGGSLGATCNKINVSSATDMGRNRTLKCSPGRYLVSIANPTNVVYQPSGPNQPLQTITYPGYDTGVVNSGKTSTVYLGVQPH